MWKQKGRFSWDTQIIPFWFVYFTPSKHKPNFILYLNIAQVVNFLISFQNKKNFQKTKLDSMLVN